MIKHKRLREKGKTGLSMLFKNLEIGDRVAIIANLSYPFNFPIRIQGRSGVIVGKQGNAFVIKLKDFNRYKKYIVEKAHLKKLG